MINSRHNHRTVGFIDQDVHTDRFREERRRGSQDPGANCDNTSIRVEIWEDRSGRGGATMEARQSRAKPLGDHTPIRAPIYLAVEKSVPEEMNLDDITILSSMSRGVLKSSQFL
jgi:hypothetical protein